MEWSRGLRTGIGNVDRRFVDKDLSIQTSIGGYCSFDRCSWMTCSSRSWWSRCYRWNLSSSLPVRYSHTPEKKFDGNCRSSEGRLLDFCFSVSVDIRGHT